MDKNLVVFPSFGTDHSFYKKLLKTAPPKWKVFILDYRELTESGGFDNFENKFLYFLNNYKLKNISLLGYSLGGALALKFSHRNPSRVKQLFLVDNTGFNITDTYQSLFINAFLSNITYFSRHPIQLLKFVIKIFSKPVWYKKQADFGKNTDLQREASQIKTPTTIFWGEKDKLIPLWHGQKLHKLIPNSNLVVLKDKKHDWILNNPELFWKEI